MALATDASELLHGRMVTLRRPTWVVGQHGCELPSGRPSRGSHGGVSLRAMAPPGALGGRPGAPPQALRVLSAAGCDVVLIETVGVGQAELEIAALADTTLVLLAPGMGDGIQAAKAGILEIGDIYVVNKADRDGADQVRRELRSMLALAERTEGSWRQPIVKTIASKGEGVDDVVDDIDAHLVWLK